MSSPKGQSKLASFIESIVNTLLGLVIAFFAQWLIVWVYDIPLSHTQNLIIVFWMTVLSVLRSYVVRRIANRLQERKLAEYDPY
jgi:uncharacterized membrane protein